MKCVLQKESLLVQNWSRQEQC